MSVRRPLLYLRRLVAQVSEQRRRRSNISVTLDPEHIEFLESTRNVSATVRRLVGDEMARVSREALDAERAKAKALEERADELRSFVSPLYIAADCYQQHQGKKEDGDKMFARARELWKQIKIVEAERDALNASIRKKERAVEDFEERRKRPRFR